MDLQDRFKARFPSKRDIANKLGISPITLSIWLSKKKDVLSKENIQKIENLINECEEH